MTKKLIYGIGYNSKGVHKTIKNGKRTKSYQAWRDMMRRCYDTDFHEIQPTYLGCSVDTRWHDFQSFAEWFYSHPYSDSGYQLDKDILVHGNKVYSPDSCVFIPKQLNVLLNNSRSSRGGLPQGVCWDKQSAKYKAQLSINGRHKNLGLFSNPQDAHTSYKKAKEAYVRDKAIEWRGRIDRSVYHSLMNWQLAT